GGEKGWGGRSAEHWSMGVLVVPLLPGGDHKGHGSELCPGQPARHRCGSDLRPQTLGLPIVQEQIAAIETARDAKTQSLLADSAAGNEARGGHGSPRDRNMV